MSLKKFSVLVMYWRPPSPDTNDPAASRLVLMMTQTGWQSPIQGGVASNVTSTWLVSTRVVKAEGHAGGKVQQGV